jgi:transposase
MLGTEVEQVSPAHTSQRRSSCGFTHESNGRSKHQSCVRSASTN